MSMAVITNDIYTREDAESLVRAGALPAQRIVGVETGACPHSAVRDDISYGLRVTGVAIVPAAFLFLALGPEIAVVAFNHGTVTLSDAHIIGYMLSAFGLGLIPFSAQFLMLRGFYAFEDTRSPFTINIWISAANVVGSSAVYYGLKGTKYDHWAIVGMCGVYGLAYCLGLAITARKLSTLLRGIDGRRIRQTYVRLTAASAVAGAAVRRFVPVA